jgi:hypothetical protein
MHGSQAILDLLNHMKLLLPKRHIYDAGKAKT